MHAKRMLLVSESCCRCGYLFMKYAPVYVRQWSGTQCSSLCNIVFHFHLFMCVFCSFYSRATLYKIKSNCSILGLFLQQWKEAWTQGMLTCRLGESQLKHLQFNNNDQILSADGHIQLKALDQLVNGSWGEIVLSAGDFQVEDFSLD